MLPVSADLNRILFLEEKLSLLYVLSGHKPPTFTWDLSDHDGDTVPVVSGPVSHLTLLAAVSDGVTSSALGELLVTSHGLVTLEAFLAVSQGLNVGLRHLVGNFWQLSIVKTILTNLEIQVRVKWF